jgi:predicted nucleic acid-binding protein
MNALFADTSYFIALLSIRDIHHRRADKYTREFDGIVITTQWIMLELANFFADSQKRAQTIELIETIITDPKTVCIPATEASFRAGWQLYQTRRDKGWSLTDCISFNSMHDRGLMEALSSDRHFEQAGFRILLK